MEKDAIDEILDQWSEERPDLDTASLGVVDGGGKAEHTDHQHDEQMTHGVLLKSALLRVE